MKRGRGPLRVAIIIIPLLATGVPAAASLSPRAREAVEAGMREEASHSTSYDGLTRLCLTPRVTDEQWSSLLEPQAPAGESQGVLLQRAWFHLAAGDGAALVRDAGALADNSEGTALHTEIQYLLAQGDWLQGRFTAAEERFDWISRHGDGDWRGWALLGQAQAALSRKDTSEALRLLQSAAALSRHDATAPALLELGRLYDERGDGQRAMRYLTLYQEAFPRGILPVMEHSVSSSDRADIMAGVTYAVQVGVFGDRTNAVRLKERIEQEGYDVRLVPRTVGDKRYTGVWVGRYRSQQDAQAARRELEGRFKDTYRVVVEE